MQKVLQWGGGGEGGGVGSNSEPIPKPPHTNSSYIYNSRDDCCVTHNGRRETVHARSRGMGSILDILCSVTEFVINKICVLLQLLPRDGAVTKNSAPGIQKPQEPTKSGGRKHCIVNWKSCKKCTMVSYVPIYSNVFFALWKTRVFLCVCVRMLMLRKIDTAKDDDKNKPAMYSEEAGGLAQ